MSRPHSRVIVVGAGVGGLAAAVALQRADIEVVVLEKAPELTPIGAGLHLWTNALAALQQLGVDEAVRGTGTELEYTRFLTAGGRLIANWNAGEAGRRLGAPTVGATRADLHAALLAALDRSVLRLGTECTGFAQDSGGVTVRCTDGREEHGDVLVGADGINSVVRIQLLGAAPPRYAGHTGWRTIVEHDGDLGPRDEFRLYSGRGARLATYPVGPGRLYWLAVAHSPPGGRDEAGEAKANVLSHFGDFCEPVPAIVQAAADERIIRGDIVDRPPIKKWGEGRVTLLGDAAHPMTPNLAQGAGLAIEDGVVLAKALASTKDTVEGLRKYEAERAPRAASMIRTSHALGTIGDWRNPLLCAFRDRVMMRIGLRGPGWKRQLKEIAYRA
jgi:2-polyprenyl-6-methoxyphenol hydroxylase-like FAD-dependent oxidoreductase